MPQLDKFTYFTQFFWLCLFFLTFYIAICNDGDGLLGIGRILKLRNQLGSRREANVRSKDSKAEEVHFTKGLSTGVSYMHTSLLEVSRWCNSTVGSLGRGKKISTLSSFGELSAARGMERRILDWISKSSTNFGKGCKDSTLIHVLHGQGNIGSRSSTRS
uniref:H(+)-transporting two-sector ATPase n=1 Tax=Pseudocaryopteris paniculata TaxID=199172 RepID=A0A6M8E669_9LAMI|nr:ATPase subunit 8 [Pseudocaryopteris paniculata]